MRLIDADKLRKAVDKPIGRLGLEGEMVMGIADNLAETEGISLVRCKDCKYAEPYTRMDNETGYYCHYPARVFNYGADSREFTPAEETDGYCSYGERKGDE